MAWRYRHQHYIYTTHVPYYVTKIVATNKYLKRVAQQSPVMMVSIAF